ncbi:radical SAM protein [Candidatus Poribacteria bacterium]|nr:radical SAM protein [Candidatus Poribacteria bacterium]
MKNLITDANLHKIFKKVESSERLSFEDGVTLYKSDDILTVGRMANIVRERKNGNKVYYNINQHIDYSNICLLHSRCHFCAYARKNIQEDGAFELSIEQFLEKAKYALENGCTEIHSVGGLHPTLPLEYYLELLRRLKEMMPQINLTFLTAVEIHHIARMSKLSVRDTLLKLKQAGLDFIPGGGAEIFAEETRNKICPGKLSGEGWLDVMRQAHQLGIRSNATMLYGHIETVEDRVDHLIRLRELQDEANFSSKLFFKQEKSPLTKGVRGLYQKKIKGMKSSIKRNTKEKSLGGFMAFVPLAFHPANTRMSHLPEPTGLTILKNIAVSRLMLDNFDHIKAYWVMSGIKLAQVALSFGADDMHGTVTEEKITHAAGAETPKALSVDEIVRLVKETGRIPVERDTFYNEIRRET